MTQFASPREALLVYYRARRGPRASKPRYDGMPSARDYRPSDDAVWVQIGQMLRAKTATFRTDDGRETTVEACGIADGSDEDATIRRWAEGMEPDGYVTRRVERRLRTLMRAAGLLPVKRGRLAVDRDGSGRKWARLVWKPLEDDDA